MSSDHQPICDLRLCPCRIGRVEAGDLPVPAWRLLPIVLLGRVLINLQPAAGHALTLRLRHGDAFLRLRLTGHFGHL
jgi:hypothetical protein